MNYQTRGLMPSTFGAHPNRPEGPGRLPNSAGPLPTSVAMVSHPMPSPYVNSSFRPQMQNMSMPAGSPHTQPYPYKDLNNIHPNHLAGQKSYLGSEIGRNAYPHSQVPPYMYDYRSGDPRVPMHSSPIGAPPQYPSAPVRTTAAPSGMYPRPGMSNSAMPPGGQMYSPGVMHNGLDQSHVRPHMPQNYSGVNGEQKLAPTKTQETYVLSQPGGGSLPTNGNGEIPNSGPEKDNDSVLIKTEDDSDSASSSDLHSSSSSGYVTNQSQDSNSVTSATPTSQSSTDPFAPSNRIKLPSQIAEKPYAKPNDMLFTGANAPKTPSPLVSSVGRIDRPNYSQGRQFSMPQIVTPNKPASYQAQFRVPYPANHPQAQQMPNAMGSYRKPMPPPQPGAGQQYPMRPPPPGAPAPYGYPPQMHTPPGAGGASSGGGGGGSGGGGGGSGKNSSGTSPTLNQLLTNTHPSQQQQQTAGPTPSPVSAPGPAPTPGTPPQSSGGGNGCGVDKKPDISHLYNGNSDYPKPENEQLHIVSDPQTLNGNGSTGMGMGTGPISGGIGSQDGSNCLPSPSPSANSMSSIGPEEESNSTPRTPMSPQVNTASGPAPQTQMIGSLAGAGAGLHSQGAGAGAAAAPSAPPPHPAPAPAPHTPSTAGSGSSTKEDDRLDHFLFSSQFGQDPHRMEFNDRLMKILLKNELQNAKVPCVAKQPVDLFKLYQLVREKGGFSKVCQQKLWKEIANIMELSSSPMASYNMRKHYSKFILAYECEYDLNGQDPKLLIAESEANTRKRPPRAKKADAGNKRGAAAVVSQSGGPLVPSGELGNTVNVCDPFSDEFTQTQRGQVPPPGGFYAKPFSPYDAPGAYPKPWGPPNEQMSPYNPRMPPTAVGPGQYPPPPPPPAGFHGSPRMMLPPDQVSAASTNRVGPGPSYPGTPSPMPPPTGAPMPGVKVRAQLNYSNATPVAHPQNGGYQRPALNSSANVKGEPSGATLPNSEYSEGYMAGSTQSWNNPPLPNSHHSKASSQNEVDLSETLPYGSFTRHGPSDPSPSRSKQHGSSSIAHIKEDHSQFEFHPMSREATQPVLLPKMRVPAIYLGNGEAAKIMKSLKSGLVAETTWALETLTVLLFDDVTIQQYGIESFPGVIDILLDHLKIYLKKIYLSHVNFKSGHKNKSKKDGEKIEHPKKNGVASIKKTHGEKKTTLSNSVTQIVVRGNTRKRKFEEVSVDHRSPVPANEESEMSSPKKLLGGNVCSVDGPSSLEPLLRLKAMSQTKEDRDAASYNCVHREVLQALEQQRIHSHKHEHLGLNPGGATVLSTKYPKFLEESVECNGFEQLFQSLEEDLEDIAQRALCVTNIFRSFSALPINDEKLAKHSGLLKMFGELLTFAHWHPVRQVNSGGAGAQVPEKKPKLDDWERIFLDGIRENCFVLLSNIASKINLDDFTEDVISTVMDALLHYMVCSASYSIDPVPGAIHSTITMQRLALETLCKMSLAHYNTDYLLATPPLSRVNTVVSVLTEMVGDLSQPATRELALVLLTNLAKTDHGVAIISTTKHFIQNVLNYLQDSIQLIARSESYSGSTMRHFDTGLEGANLFMARCCSNLILRITQTNPQRVMRFRKQLLLLTSSDVFVSLDTDVGSILSSILFELNS